MNQHACRNKIVSKWYTVLKRGSNPGLMDYESLNLLTELSDHTKFVNEVFTFRGA